MFKIIKRAGDIFLSLVVLILCSPLLIPISIGLRLTAEGYVFYFQDRLGYKNKKFRIYKFATMLKDSPSLLTGSVTIKDDPRVTPIGKYLRITKVNELPQIINVLNGDMSIVGPRPLMQEDFDAYPPHVQEKIYDVKPGITGIGSLIFRDEELVVSSATDRDPVEFYQNVIAPYKGELELWYRKNQSFYVDFMMIILTGLAIVYPKGDFSQKIFKTLPKRNF